MNYINLSELVTSENINFNVAIAEFKKIRLEIERVDTLKYDAYMENIRYVEICETIFMNETHLSKINNLYAFPSNIEVNKEEIEKERVELKKDNIQLSNELPPGYIYNKDGKSNDNINYPHAKIWESIVYSRFSENTCVKIWVALDFDKYVNAQTIDNMGNEYLRLMVLIDNSIKAMKFRMNEKRCDQSTQSVSDLYLRINKLTQEVEKLKLEKDHSCDLIVKRLKFSQYFPDIQSRLRQTGNKRRYA